MAEEQPRRILWFIDENARELQTYAQILRRLLPQTIEVREQKPYPSMQEYVSLLENPQTSCIITDQQLKVSGVAGYTGIDLAEYLRQINTKLPIYILTNFSEDRDAFLDGEWSVEDIISKENLRKSHEQVVIAARISRRIDVYNDVQDSRTQRVQTLLTKSLDDELSPDEVAEIETLLMQKNSPHLADELLEIQQMEEVIKAHEDLMRRYREIEDLEDKDGK